MVMAGATIGIEVRTGGFKVGTFALGELVDVKGVLARRKILDVELDANAVRSLRESGGADDLILSVLDIDGKGFGRRRRRGVRDSSSKEQAENDRERFHETSLESTADRVFGQDLNL